MFLQWRPDTSVLITGLILTYRVFVSGQTQTSTDTFILLDSLHPGYSYTFYIRTCFEVTNYCGNNVFLTKTIPEDGKSKYVFVYNYCAGTFWGESVQWCYSVIITKTIPKDGKSPIII